MTLVTVQTPAAHRRGCMGFRFAGTRCFVYSLSGQFLMETDISWAMCTSQDVKRDEDFQKVI